MIEIRCIPSGDVAYAETPEEAVLAARQLCADDFAHMPVRGRSRACTFQAEGSPVVVGPVPELEIRRQAGALR